MSGLDGRSVGPKDWTILGENSRLEPNRFVMKPSVTRTLVSLSLIFGAGVAPLSVFTDSCSSRVQAAQAEQCGGCCSTSTTSCCDKTAIARDCACSRPASPPVDPTQRDRSTQRVELRWVAIGLDIDAAVDSEHKTSHLSDVVTSSSWPTTRLQAVLCRWLT